MADWDVILAESKRLQKIEELARKVMEDIVNAWENGELCVSCGSDCDTFNDDDHCQNSDCDAFQLGELLKQGEQK